MLSPRRTLAALLAATTLWPAAGAPPATASYADTPYVTTTVVVPMHFPVLGPTSYTDTYLVCRDGCARKHFGQDLMGPKMRPLVAAFNGYVSALKRESYVGEGNYISITGDNGWSVNYMHVNNDTPGTDDGKGTASYAFAPGIYLGKRVFTGELIGWSGDSGNAESTGPHLHFELRRGGPWDTVYNAYASLTHAFHDLHPTTSGPHPDGVYVRACGLCKVYRISNGKKYYLSKDVAGQVGFDGRMPVTVTQNEVNWYPTGGNVMLPSGRAYRTADGTVWFVLGRTRYHVTREQLDALGIPLTRVRPMGDAGLATVRAAADGAEVPSGLVYEGALLNVPGAEGQYWYVLNGERRLVTDADTLKSWGLSAADAITLPETVPPVEGVDPAPDPLDLAPLGSPLRLRDGAVIKDSYNHLFLVTGGQRRPFSSLTVYRMYGYTTVLQQTPAGDAQRRLSVGPRMP